MVGDDGKFNGVTRIQTIAASLNFRHVEEEFLAFINLVVEEAKLTFNGVDNGSLLLTYSGNLTK